MERDYQYPRAYIATLDSNTQVFSRYWEAAARNANAVQLSEGANNTLQPATVYLHHSICSYLWLEDTFSFLPWEEL